MVILSGAKHPIAANLWINYILDAQVSAANSNYIGYMGPNEAASSSSTRTSSTTRRSTRTRPSSTSSSELLDLGADLDKYTDRWLAARGPHA